MNYRAMLTEPVELVIRDFHLKRELLIRLLTALNTDVPLRYERCRRFRVHGDERMYRDRVVLPDGDVKHLFRLGIDDTTAQGILLISSIRHFTRREP